MSSEPTENNNLRAELTEVQQKIKRLEKISLGSLFITCVKIAEVLNSLF